VEGEGGGVRRGRRRDEWGVSSIYHASVCGQIDRKQLSHIEERDNGLLGTDLGSAYPPQILHLIIMGDRNTDLRSVSRGNVILLSYYNFCPD
jgi:hypothetical protein